MGKIKLSSFEKNYAKVEAKISNSGETNRVPIDEIIKAVRNKNNTPKKLTLDRLKAIGVAIDGGRELKPLKGGLLFNQAIHIIHAPSGYGKTTTAIKLAGETGMDVIYLDFELNPTTKDEPFAPRNLCKSENIAYTWANDEHDAVASILKLGDEMEGIILIIDSFSSILVSGNNEATDTKDIVKAIQDLVTKLGATIIIIEHSTKGDKSKIEMDGTEFDFKLEGSESGKKKLADLQFKIQPFAGSHPSSGIKLKVDKSRVSGLVAGGVYHIIDAEGNMRTDKLERHVLEGAIASDDTHVQHINTILQKEYEANKTKYHTVSHIAERMKLSHQKIKSLLEDNKLNFWVSKSVGRKTKTMRYRMRNGD